MPLQISLNLTKTQKDFGVQNDLEKLNNVAQNDLEKTQFVKNCLEKVQVVKNCLDKNKQG